MKAQSELDEDHKDACRFVTAWNVTAPSAGFRTMSSTAAMCSDVPAPCLSVGSMLCRFVMYRTCPSFVRSQKPDAEKSTGLPSARSKRPRMRAIAKAVN